MKYLLAAVIGAILVASVQADGGYHWVNPYHEHNGEYHRGHWQGNPDGNPYNNLNYPGNSYPFNPR